MLGHCLQSTLRVESVRQLLVVLHRCREHELRLLRVVHRVYRQVLLGLCGLHLGRLALVLRALLSADALLRDEIVDVRE